MKPAVRIAALQKLHVVWVWSHDSFRVGEDGPTHQPIEQEAQIRLMEQLRNHSGDRSTIVLRPADGAETVEAWKYAMEADRPVALILSRQNIKDLPSKTSRRNDAKQLAKGAYVVVDNPNPDVIMISNGSEVATLVEGAELLSAEGIKVRIVSAPSEGLFRDQPAEYQHEVIPYGIPHYGLTSGLPVTIRGLVGDTDAVGAKNFIHGLDHFGYSAPYKVLDEKFGFSGENVYNQVKKLLNT
jgi:transketolase